MNSAKALCLAAVVSGALVCLVGAASASATVLCATTSTPCNNRWGPTTKIDSDLSGTSTVASGSVSSTCSGSTLQITTTTAGGMASTVEGSFANVRLTWTGCTSTTSTVLGGTVEFHHIANTENATLTGKTFKLTVILAGLDCVYGPTGAGADLGTFTGGASPSFDINAGLPKVEGPVLCPASVTWTATYSVTDQEIYVEPE